MLEILLILWGVGTVLVFLLSLVRFEDSKCKEVQIPAILILTCWAWPLLLPLAFCYMVYRVVKGFCTVVRAALGRD